MDLKRQAIILTVLLLIAVSVTAILYLRAQTSQQADLARAAIEDRQIEIMATEYAKNH